MRVLSDDEAEIHPGTHRASPDRGGGIRASHRICLAAATAHRASRAEHYSISIRAGKHSLLDCHWTRFRFAAARPNGSHGVDHSGLSVPARRSLPAIRRLYLSSVCRRGSAEHYLFGAHVPPGVLCGEKAWRPWRRRGRRVAMGIISERDHFAVRKHFGRRSVRALSSDDSVDYNQALRFAERHPRRVRVRIAVGFYADDERDAAGAAPFPTGLAGAVQRAARWGAPRQTAGHPRHQCRSDRGDRAPLLRAMDHSELPRVPHLRAAAFGFRIATVAGK